MTDKLHELFLQVKIGNVMNKAVVTVYEDEDLSIAQEKFLAHTVSHILVLDRRDRLSWYGDPPGIQGKGAPSRKGGPGSRAQGAP